MPDDLTRSITLITPVSAYGESVTQVTVRRPTAKELRLCGQPYVVVTGGGGGVKADYNACAALLTYVCDPPLPSGSVDALDAADFDDLAMILVGFTKRAPRGVSADGSQPTS
jgi:Phage tail assembly chaperone proteins, E, or 41 or 14